MAGRKSKYETFVKPYLDEINKKVRQGVIEEEIAKSLGICVASLNNYRNKYPEFAEALSKGKGKEVLQELINAGIESAKGYYKDEVTITTNAKGEETKVVSRKWYPPNPSLNQFYTKIYGKDDGFVSDPLDYALKKAKHELDEAIAKEKNWTLNIDNN